MNRTLIVPVALLLVGGAFWMALRPGEESGREAALPPAKAEREARPSPGARPPAVPSELPTRDAALSAWDLPKAKVSPFDDESDDHKIWIDEKVAELQDLSWFFDEPEILNKVMAELRSPEPELRNAAREAVLNLGSRDAIPYLESAAALAETPAEKKALVEAAEYLKLPTVLEIRDQRGE